MSRRSRLAAILFIAAVSCRSSASFARSDDLSESLRIDSTHYTLKRYEKYLRADIRFAYTNGTGTVVSIDPCRSPSSATLDKRVTGDRWITAYTPIWVECLWMPPIKINQGATYRGGFTVIASPPGTRDFGAMPLDSIPAVYRLHWVLHRGLNAADTTVKLLHVVSPAFRLVMPDSTR